jgi:hypothetical protein
VENPLINIDMVNTMGVKYIPDTEDFLEEIGHLGVPSKMRRLPREVCVCVNIILCVCVPVCCLVLKPWFISYLESSAFYLPKYSKQSAD